MIGDKISLREEYKSLAYRIQRFLFGTNFFNEGSKKVIAICGESGSGKSVTANALAVIFEEFEIESTILHQDDYFFLPPKTNHEARLKDIEHIGSKEVNLDLMQNHLYTFKNKVTTLSKPLVDYDQNLITLESISTESSQLLILEGTYALMLDHIDFGIFIDRTYHQTLQQRIARNRDIIDEFSNQVLEIEHQIIKKLKHKADAVIDAKYNFQPNKHENK